MDPATLILLVQLSGCDPDRDWRCAAQGPIRRQEEPHRNSDLLNPFNKEQPAQRRALPDYQEIQRPRERSFEYYPLGPSFQGCSGLSPCAQERRRELFEDPSQR